MLITIDQAGRLVLPKKVRDRLGLKSGSVLEVRATADGVYLTPEHHTPRLVKDGNVLVFNGADSTGDAADAVDEHRRSRIDELVRQAMQ